MSTPFAWYNQTCSIQHQTLYLAVSESTLTGTNFIKQISGTALHQCKPYENKLCYLPRFAADTAHGPGCAKILYVGSSISEINQHCPLHCITSQLVSISEIAHDTFVITHPQPDLTITCKNHKTLLPNTFYSTPGALKLKLPCYCRLSSPTYDLIPERYPCPENQPLNLRMHHIIPAAWSHLKSFMLQPTNPHHEILFANISENLNSNWTLDMPHLNLTTTTATVKEILSQINTPTVSYADTYGFHGDSLLLLWNILLSIAVLYLLFHSRLPALTVIPQAAPVNATDKVTHHHDTLFGLLISGIIICVIYFIFRYLLSRRRSRTSTLRNSSGTDSNRFTIDFGDQENFERFQQGNSVDISLNAI